MSGERVVEGEVGEGSSSVRSRRMRSPMASW